MSTENTTLSAISEKKKKEPERTFRPPRGYTPEKLSALLILLFVLRILVVLIVLLLIVLRILVLVILSILLLTVLRILVVLVLHDRSPFLRR